MCQALGIIHNIKIQSMASKILYANENYRQVNKKLQYNEISANACQVHRVLEECWRTQCWALRCNILE